MFCEVTLFQAMDSWQQHLIQRFIDRFVDNITQVTSQYLVPVDIPWLITNEGWNDASPFCQKQDELESSLSIQGGKYAVSKKVKPTQLQLMPDVLLQHCIIIIIINNNFPTWNGLKAKFVEYITSLTLCDTSLPISQCSYPFRAMDWSRKEIWITSPHHHLLVPQNGTISVIFKISRQNHILLWGWFVTLQSNISKAESALDCQCLSRTCF